MGVSKIVLTRVPWDITIIRKKRERLLKAYTLHPGLQHLWSWLLGDVLKRRGGVDLFIYLFTLGSSPYGPDAPRPHNLISAQDSPVPLPKFQVAPRLKILMSSESKKGTQIHYSFLSKVPANKSPPGSPTGPLWREMPVSRAFLNIWYDIFSCNCVDTWWQ